MGLSAPSHSLQPGSSNEKGFRKPKPVNMKNNSKGVTNKKGQNRKWKKAKPKNSSGLNPNTTGLAMVNPNQNPLGIVNPSQNTMAMINPSNSTLPMVPLFGAPSQRPLMSYALQALPRDPYFMMNAPADNRFKGNNYYGIVPRNLFKKRRILSKRKMGSPFLSAPLAPRNTTSFIMRAKKLGGIAPAVTPSPATPAVFPTPLLSPGVRDKGSLEEMNQELGVDGYGSMNGLIRLRSYEDRARDESESESDVEQGDIMNEEHSIQSVERLEQRIDQGLSRFEIIYPSRSMEVDGVPSRNLQNCVISQERLIAHLEEENLTLKERLFLLEQELIELRRRVRELEGLNGADELKEEHCEESCGDISMPYE